MKNIDSEKLIAEIERLKQENEISDDKEYAPYELDVACGYDMACEKILSLITTLQQEEDKDSKEAAIQYRDSIIKRIEEKRVLPSFKGQLLHDFKNELNTMNQLLDIKNWSDIQYALFEKFALVFATWGGYHFHPKEIESEDSLQQEQPGVDFETEYAKFSNDPDELDYAFPIDLADYKDFARHFYELGLNTRKEE